MLVGNEYKLWLDINSPNAVYDKIEYLDVEGNHYTYIKFSGEKIKKAGDGDVVFPHRWKLQAVDTLLIRYTHYHIDTLNDDKLVISSNDYVRRYVPAPYYYVQEFEKFMNSLNKN